jgi:ATP-dependent helicase HrpB
MPSSPHLPQLPIDDLLPQVRAALATGPNLVITAPPGAGKTTRIPPALLGAPWLPDTQTIVVLQPRRVAARASAARIAEEHGWRLGEEVGYQIRFENRTSPRTRLRVITEGILARQLAADPFLEGVGCVILDEFHERSLHCDLALALLREVQRTIRPELRIIVMSATLEAAPIAEFLATGVTPAPILASAGRLFPVALDFLPRHDPRPAPELCAETILRLLADPAASAGHILVFLPGIGEIRKTETLIRPAIERAGVALHVLHSSVSPAAQDAALHPSTRRKLILATNIAETSLTIDGVTVVIDSGWSRVPIQDARLGIDRLELRRISQASATQRTGRAGRTAPGRCLRLWTRSEDAALPERDTPEIHRLDLAAPLLAVKSFGYADPATFAWFEPPRPDALARAGQLLHWLGATDTRGALSDLGRRLAQLPLHPRLGCLLLAAARQGLAAEAATLAALLHDGEQLFTPAARRHPAAWEGDSDLLDLLPADPAAASALPPLVQRTREHLLRSLGRNAALRKSHSSDQGHDIAAALRKLLLHAYPDRVTLRRTGDPARGIMVGGRGVALDPASGVRRAPLFLSLDPRETPGAPSSAFKGAASKGAAANAAAEARVSLASAIEPEWLAEVFPHLLRRETALVWDAPRARIMAHRQTWFLDLIIDEKTAGADPRDPATGEALAVALRPEAERLISADPITVEWLARVALLRRAMPELQYRDFTAESLFEILAQGCAGHYTRAELDKVPWRDLLAAALIPAQRAALAREAPEALTVPSGSKIRLDYTSGDNPVLAVRLQEMFGCADTPRLAAGRVPVVLHLLAPNQRPVQVTRDLRNFWNTTYQEVRKELRIRYPKHPWPEDPWSAPPTHVGRRRH